jgi:hypothetical protein
VLRRILELMKWAENCTRNSMTLLLSIYPLQHEKIKENEMGGACGMLGRGKNALC